MNPLNHVAIIMDGNGRWVWNTRILETQDIKQVKTVEKIIKATIQNKISFLTLFAFSTENWKRPKKEINYLFKLLENFLKNEIVNLVKRKIRLKIIGKKKFSKDLNQLINKAEKLTKNFDSLQVNLALNYGSKDELTRSFKQLNKK